MWTITIEAPNGLESKVRIDEMLLELAAPGPHATASMTFGMAFDEMWARRDEKNPNEEANQCQA